MSKFSLNKLTKSLAEKSGLSQMESELFVRKMFDVCNQGLAQDKQVKIKWLGTFKILPVKDRESVDVNTGERILIEGRDKLSFTPDNILKEIINKPFAQFETVVVNDGVDFDIVDKMFDVEENEDDVEDEFDDNPEEAEPEETAEVIALPYAPAKIAEQENAEWQKALEEEKESLEEENKVEEEEHTEEEHTEEEEKAIVKVQPAEEESSMRRHLVIPRYLLAVACLVFVVLITGIGWIAFNYGKMEAQCHRLAMELSEYRKAETTTIKKKVRPKSKPSVPGKSQIPETPEQTLKRKAREDSIRMAKASEAVEKVEVQQNEAGKPKKEQEDISKKKAAETKQNKENADETATTSSRYEKDVRVRTGAYRITGVSQTVKAKVGQSLASISKTYLGPGMECYVEAINGTTSIKPGQEVKIPKLELKKKKQK